VEKLAASLGVTGLSKSQVSVMAAELDELVESFRNRPLDRGPYTFVRIDALTQKVREGGRTVNVHCLIATGVNAGGCREILGIDVTSSEDGAGWLAFLRGLAARGLSGVQLVTSDDHAGLVSAIAAVLPGAAWQRCRTHYHRNLLTRVPKTAQPWVSTLVRTIFEQPDPKSVRTQHAQVTAALEAKLPAAAAHLEDAREDILAFTAFPREVWRQIWSNNPCAGTAEQGGPPPHRRGRHLPRPGRHHPPGRRGAGRAERRMDRVPPVYGTGNPRRLPESRPGRHGTGYY
jgi:transposase-like protein